MRADRRASEPQRRRRRAAPRTWRDRLRHPTAARAAHALAAIAGLLYLAGGAYTVGEATGGVGGLVRGMTPTDARYVQGPPSAQDQAPGGDLHWQWREADRVLDVGFDAGTGRLARASCIAPAGRGGACPERLGLGTGSPEDAVWRTLGVPDRQSFAGEGKVIGYDDLGLEFHLRRFAVYRSDIVPRRGTPYGRLLRVLVP